MPKLMRAVGWIAYCVRLDKGTAVHRGPWRGWVEKKKAAIENLIKTSGRDVPYATLVPAKLFVAVPVYKKPVTRCPTCRKPKSKP